MASKRSRRPLDDPPAASSSEEEEDAAAADSSDEEGEEEVQLPVNAVKKPQQPEDDEEEDEEEEEEEQEEENKSEAEAEEEEEEEDEEETEDEEENQDKKKTSAPPAARAKRVPQTQSPSESEESQKASDYTIKPVAAASTKAAVKEPETAASKKRVDNGPAPKAKRAKTSNGDVEEAGTVEKKGGGVHRLWSDEDELAILKGLIDFKAKTGQDPAVKQVEYHEFVKKSLHVEVSRNQLMDKVRRLKKKYLNNAAKATGGVEPIFSKPHDIKTYRLSKQCWGSSANGDDDEELNGDANGKKNSSRTKPIASKSNDVKPSSTRSAKKSDSDKQALSVASVLTNMSAKEEDLKKGKGVEKVSVLADCEDGDLAELYPSLIDANGKLSKLGLVPGFDGVDRSLSALGKSKLKALDDKAKKLALMEMEVRLARIEFMREQTLELFNVMKSSN